jgi:2-oxoglutarate ferredoxin oxidoreductase subunit delta
MKFKLTFDEDQCKGCELCSAMCKKGLIYMDESRVNKIGAHPAAIADQDACVGCQSCALMCPDAIITIEKPE